MSNAKIRIILMFSLIALLTAMALSAADQTGAVDKDLSPGSKQDSLPANGNERDSLSAGSKYQVFMSITAMSDRPNIIGNFLNLQRYSARQSIASAHRQMKKRAADMSAKKFWLESIFTAPLEIAPFDIPWPIQCDVRLDNDFHTVTPLISF